MLGTPALAGASLTSVRGRRQVGLLSILVAHGGEVVRRDVLEEQLWDGRRVSGSALRVTANRLREQFRAITGDDPVVGDRTGFRLEVDPTVIDAVAYERLVADADRLRWSGDARKAAALVDDAEALWRGPAYDGSLDLPTVRAEHDRLERLRVGVLEQTAADLVVLGDLERAVELAGLIVDRHPYRETAWALRVAGLHQQGRAAEAVHEYERLTAILRAELGLEPSGALRALHRAITSGGFVAEALEPVLAEAGHRAPPPERLTVRSGAGATTTPYVGRATELRRLVGAVTDGPAIQVVEGAAGLGKTRLTAEVGATLAARGWAVHPVGCSRGGGGGLEPVAELADRLLDGLDHHRLAELEPLHALAPGRFDGLLPRRVEPDADLRRLVTTIAVNRLLAERAAEAPTLVVVDDVHWIGSAGAALLAYLLDHAPGVRWILACRESDRTPASTGFLADLAGRDVSWTRVEPMSDADIDALVRSVVGADVGDRIDDIVARAGGSPLLAIDLARHRAAGGGDDVPSSVAAIVAAAIAGLRPAAVHATRAVVVAGRTVPLATLAEVAELTEDDAEDAVVEATAAGLLATSEQGIAASHDLVAQAVFDQVAVADRRRWHRRWSRAWARRSSQQHLALAHLIAAGDAEADELDEVAAPALRALLASGAMADAAALANDYVAAVGSTPTTRAGIDGRLQAAAAILTVDVNRGRALYDSVWPQVRRLGDPLLLADALLARGPIDLGGRDRHQEVEIALDVLDGLPLDEVDRRVQVGSWAAHHLIGRGDPEGADRLLTAAEADLARRPSDSLRGLLLGIRAQATMVATSTPTRVRHAHDDLVAFSTLSGDLNATIIGTVFEIDRRFRDGTRADVLAAVDRLEVMTGTFPRQDLTWWVATARSAVALSADGLAEVARATDAAAALGDVLRIALGSVVRATHRMLQRWADGTLAELRPLVTAPDAGTDTALLLGCGLVGVASGDLDLAKATAALAVERRPLLAPEGNVWALTAGLAGELAFRTGDAALGETLVAELQPHAGTGLSGSGLVHLGAVDRVLGQSLAAAGSLDDAVAALESGFELDRARGWSRWAERAALAAAEVLERRAGRPDRARGDTLRSEAAHLHARREHA